MLLKDLVNEKLQKDGINQQPRDELGHFLPNPDGNPKIKIGVYLDREDYEVIKKEATRRGMRYSGYIRMILREIVGTLKEKQ